MGAPITKDEHAEHHQMLRDLGPELHQFLEERRAARRRMEKIKDSAIGAIVVGLVGGIFTLLAVIGHEIEKLFR